MHRMNQGKRQRQLVCLSLICALCAGIAVACGSATHVPVPTATATLQSVAPRSPPTQGTETYTPTSCPRFTPEPTGIYYTLDISGVHEIVMNQAVIDPTPTRLILYMLYAGAYKANLQQGLIIEAQLNSDPCASSAPDQSAYHPTPTQQGAVTLTKIVGDTVTFTTANGGSGTFNFVSGQYS